MRFITLDINNKIVSIRNGDAIIEGEIHSDIGEIGQIMQFDGTFINPEPEPVNEIVTIEDKINYIFYKMQGVI